MKELLALARSRPETLTQASAGTGAPGHLSGELLQQMTQTRFVHVPYKGVSLALIDLIGGQVDLSFPEEFAAFLAEDLRKCAKVIKAANMRPSQI